ncbi:PaaI family thioesterase [Chloroflexota bacterium]
MTNWPKVPVDTGKDFTMCFACGKDNPIGLQLKFKPDGKTARAEFTPSKFHQGWAGIVHGGVIDCILDEAMSYATRFAGIKCVTAKMQARLRRLALVDESLVITSSVTRKTRKLAETEATISLKDGTLVAEGTATMFIFDPGWEYNPREEE